MNHRIGQGYDVHAFGPGNSVTLGGVSIPYERGLVAHSDGDVVIHALCDAILGALALGDLGDHFPDTDPAYKDAASGKLLLNVYEKAKHLNWKLVNADITLVAQAPKISPHKLAMRQFVASTLEVDIDTVSIKATTTEFLGFAGRKEGIAAYAVVLLGKT